MQKPDLEHLKQGSSEEWDVAFAWLWPSVFAVVKGKLGEGFAADVEDVTLECIEALVEKVCGATTIDELKLLALGIARNKAVDYLRRRWATKRDDRKGLSLTALETLDPERLADNFVPPLVDLDAAEMVAVLQALLERLELRERQLLNDFYVGALSYAAMAERHGVPLGSVGVLLARAREKAWKILKNTPGLMKELEGLLR